MSKRRTKTFSEGLSRRFDKAKEYPGEPDNRTLENLLNIRDYMEAKIPEQRRLAEAKKGAKKK